MEYPTPEKEFRAKLSEVVFAPLPRLALGAIVSPNSGDVTPHGRANARALTGVMAWMRAHASEINGLNPSLPLQPQFTLLTDDQIRAAFLSLPYLALARAINPLTGRPFQPGELNLNKAHTAWLRRCPAVAG